MLITVDTFDTRVAFVPDTFTHRIFVDLGIPLGNTRGIKIDRIPSIDQRKVSFDVEPSSQNHPERNLPLPLPIKCRPNFSFYALRRALVIFAGVGGDAACMHAVCRVARRSACGRFNSFKIICFLPDLSPLPLLVRATFSENYASARVNAAPPRRQSEIRSIFFAPPLSTENYSAW